MSIGGYDPDCGFSALRPPRFSYALRLLSDLLLKLPLPAATLVRSSTINHLLSTGIDTTLTMATKVRWIRKSGGILKQA